MGGFRGRFSEMVFENSFRSRRQAWPCDATENNKSETVLRDGDLAGESEPATLSVPEFSLTLTIAALGPPLRRSIVVQSTAPSQII